MAVKRLNYFHYQFLQENDFTDEQTYHLDMRRRHNQDFHTWGRVKGLDVSFAAGERKVTISHGMAVDSLGREIIVESNYEKDLQSYAGQSVYLVLSYEDHETDPTTQPEVTGNTRVTESFQAEVYSAASPPLGWDKSLKLILAKITLNPGPPSDGAVISVDSSERTEAGAKIGESTFPGVKLMVPGHGGAEWPELKGVEVSAPGSGLQGIEITSQKTTFTGSLEVKGTIGVTGTVDGRDVSADGTKLDGHVSNTNNPHGTTAAQVGALPSSGGTISGNLQVNGNIGVTGTVDGRDVSADGATLTTHVGVTNGNPHGTTAAQVGALPVSGGNIVGSLTVGQNAQSAILGSPPGIGGAQNLFGMEAGKTISVFITGNPNPNVSGAPPTALLIWPLLNGCRGLSIFEATGGVDTMSVAGTARFSGTKIGYVADTCVNASGRVLHTGDVVKLKSSSNIRFHGDNNRIPIPEVIMSDSEDDPLVIGIVAQEATPTLDEPDRRTEPEDPTSIPDGGELFVVTLGTFAHCRVDATTTPIAVGDLLTSSVNPGHAKKATNPKLGSIIGKALESLKEGTGYIAVFVNIQ